MKKDNIKERLQTLVGFIENMEGLVKNPYTAGLKTEDMLKDIKAFVQETLPMVDEIEEVSQDFVGEPEPSEESK